MNLSKLNSGYVLLFFQQLLAYASLSFVPLFFKNQGYSLSELVLMYTVYTFLTAVLISLVNVFNLRFSLAGGILGLVGMNLLMFFNLEKISFWGYPVLGMITIVLFWIPLNYLFFSGSNKNNHGRESALYQIVASFFGVFLPSLGAFLISWKGYPFLFMLCAFLHLPLLIYVEKKIPAERIKTQLIPEIKKFKGLKTISIAEGALQFFAGIVLIIYSLFFISQEQQFGFFLGYLGLISLVIALFLSIRSDHFRKRMGYLYILFILMTLSIFSLIFARDLKSWVILTGIYSLLTTISFPLRLAVSLDVKKVDLGFWRMRELFLNVGRFITLGITFIFFYYQIYWLIFLMFGVIALSYPFLIKYKFRELK